MLGLSYRSPLRPSNSPTGLSCNPLAPSLASSSSSSADGSCGSKIDRDPGVREGDSADELATG